MKYKTPEDLSLAVEVLEQRATLLSKLLDEQMHRHFYTSIITLTLQFSTLVLLIITFIVKAAARQ